MLCMFFPTYFIPKWSTMRVKHMGLDLWVQSTGVNLTGWYPCLSRWFLIYHVKFFHLVEYHTLYFEFWYRLWCCFFSCIVTVHVWWHQLKINVFNIEDFVWGCWKLHCQVFERVVLSLWLLGCCIMFHMHWKLLFFKLLLLLLGWHCCFSHKLPWCIYWLWNIWLGIFLSGLNI